MKDGMRAIQGLIGGAGTVVVIGFVYMAYAMHALIHPALPPAEKCLIFLDRVFARGPMPVVVTVAFGALNGFLWLCLTAGWPNRRPFRRLVLSSALTAVVMVLLPLLVLLAVASG